MKDILARSSTRWNELLGSVGKAWVANVHSLRNGLRLIMGKRLRDVNLELL